MTARLIIGDAITVVRDLPTGSIDCVITSPPYWRKRDYLDPADPAKVDEMGQEATPGEFLGGLLRLTDELWRVLADHGTIWINLGDTAAGSGGAGGDYNPGGLREGQQRYEGSARTSVGTRPSRDRAHGAARLRQGTGQPLPKSVCWLPQLFGASLAYGRNLLTGEPCQQWVTRPPVTWCKPNPPVGEIIDKFREATEMIVWASKTSAPGGYYFDLDAVRVEAPPENERTTWNQNGPKSQAAEAAGKARAGRERFTVRTVNPNGAPPLDWWEIPTKPYPGSHFATFPSELIQRPIVAGVPKQVCTVCGRPRRRISEPTEEYSQHLGSDMFGGRDQDDRKAKGRQARNGTHPHVNRESVTVGWTDCGCEQGGGARWRPGVVLDPFGGSGTTGAVAVGHGVDCILIDLEHRNEDLIRERVGMFLEDVVAEGVV